jgi:uncharacterized membrane protein YgdD (TMEM256/DUF423 family)
MKRGEYDFLIGSIVIFLIFTLMVYISKNFLDIVILLFSAGLTIYAGKLWHRKSRRAKIFAVILLPVLIFCIFLPKKLKLAIRNIEIKNF